KQGAVADAGEILPYIGRVTTLEDRVGEDPVAHPVGTACRAGVLGTGPVRTNDRLVVGESDSGRMSGRAQRFHREPVAEEKMVGCGQCGRRVLVPGGVMAVVVAEEGRAPRLVDGHPVADSVTERIGDHLSVVTEAMSGVTVWPSAGVLELLGQVPVVEGRPGLNAGFQEGVHEAAVEV